PASARWLDLGCLPRAPAPADRTLAGAAALLARDRLRRLAVRAPAPELLLARRFLRRHRPRVHAVDLPAAPRGRERAGRRAHRRDGGDGDDRLRHHRLPDRLLRGAPRPRMDEGTLLPRRDDAALVELPGEDLRLAADPGEGRQHDGARGPAAPRLATRSG